VDYMHRDLVGRRRWIAEADYRERLALAQLAPGRLVDLSTDAAEGKSPSVR
jgi:chromate transport protein ChrA